MKKRFGFTLAEVLITLGIIGVVAAMTIPTLIQNTNSTRFASQFKKTLTTIAQAGEMAQAQYSVDFGGLTQNCANANSDTLDTDAAANVVNSICGLINSTMAGVRSVANANLPAVNNADGTNFRQVQNGIGYTLADGSLLVVNPNMGSSRCALAPGFTLNQAVAGDAGANALPGACFGYIDVNGAAMPNAPVQCNPAASTSVTDLDAACTVRTNATDTRDVYPIAFHDGIVEPASNAARVVLSRGR